MRGASPAPALTAALIFLVAAAVAPRGVCASYFSPSFQMAGSYPRSGSAGCRSASSRVCDPDDIISAGVRK